MKLFKFLAAALIAISISSCRNTETPEDVHEHEEVNKIKITYTEAGTTNTKTVTYQTGTGASGAIDLDQGKVYNVSLNFYHNNNGTDEDLTGTVIAEKDEHFVKYQFSGVNVSMVRTSEDAVRTDGKKLGLKTVWTVTSNPVSANSIIQLVHKPTSVDDAANNGGGATTGGEADVNAQFTVN